MLAFEVRATDGKCCCDSLSGCEVKFDVAIWAVGKGIVCFHQITLHWIVNQRTRRRTTTTTIASVAGTHASSHTKTSARRSFCVDDDVERMTAAISIRSCAERRRRLRTATVTRCQPIRLRRMTSLHTERHLQRQSMSYRAYRVICNQSAIDASLCNNYKEKQTNMFCSCLNSGIVSSLCVGRRRYASNANVSDENELVKSTLLLVFHFIMHLNLFRKIYLFCRVVVVFDCYCRSSGSFRCKANK